MAVVCTHVTHDCPVKWTVYGYAPDLAANLFFCVVFGLLFVSNIALGVFYRTWTYMVAMSLASLAAAIGYVGRILMHYNAWNYNGFIMQICALILSPAFNSAAVYLTLKHITLHFGQEFSRLKPAWYTYIFITGDLIAMILQAIGGGLAATWGTNRHQLKLGDHIMNAGVSWQVFCLLFFTATALDFVVRRWKASKVDVPLTNEMRQTLGSLKFKLFAGGVAAAVFLVLTRCIYRIAEMAKGFGNPIMRNEGLFIVFEGSLILAATLFQTLFHPGYCFPAMSGKETIESKEAAMSPSEHMSS